MWWITIVLDLALVLIGFLICALYYNKHYGGFLGELSLDCLKTYNVFLGNWFEAMPLFSNFSCNILTKGIITIISILIVHFTDKLWITYLYCPYLIATYRVYGKRVQLYMSEDKEERETIRPPFVASFLLPLFHTLFFVLLFLTYILNAR